MYDNFMQALTSCDLASRSYFNSLFLCCASAKLLACTMSEKDLCGFEDNLSTDAKGTKDKPRVSLMLQRLS